ncbi:uncharacterized protein [Miscanthus floridulus]|uniref:uncharacterized protein n=1 Tax=Miscanthus floridulus TaxID=154761 RepID=UPI00345971C1
MNRVNEIIQTIIELTPIRSREIAAQSSIRLPRASLQHKRKDQSLSPAVLTLRAVCSLVAPTSSLSSSWSRARAQQPPSPKKDISLSDGDVNLTNANVAVVLRCKSAILSVRHWHVLLDATGHLILSMHDRVLPICNKAAEPRALHVIVLGYSPQPPCACRRRNAEGNACASWLGLVPSTLRTPHE